MKKFLAIYTGTEAAVEKSGWNRLSKDEQKQREGEAFKAWMDWGTKHAAVIVDQGAPLGKTKRADREGIKDIKNAMTGYVVIQAETHEAAARLFEKHPHFMLFPGDGVEIMECLPMPEK
jgi:hypothetical protein